MFAVAPAVAEQFDQLAEEIPSAIESLSARLEDYAWGAVVGVLTWLGLWMVGVPLAPVLGLIAALLAFIPNIGPIIAVVPAILLAFPDGPSTVLMVFAVYMAVQTLESYASI